jgi:5'-nucleotidase
MRILATNDDGIMAPGLVAMRQALATLGDVTVVAPTTAQSAVGHAISVTEPVICHRMDLGDGSIGYGIEGSPADCVKLAVLELLPARPDLVVSGINLGANAGINVLYSGTVAAAIEAAFWGVPSAAVSLEDSEVVDFGQAARIALGILRQLVGHGLAGGAAVNINVPDLSAGPPRGVRVVPQSMKGWRERWERRSDPRGRTYYWIFGEKDPEAHGIDSDVAALADRFVTVTPLGFDLTAHDRLAAMRACDLRL